MMIPCARSDIDAILTHVAESLDISPTDYERAVRSYNSVGKWLEDGYVNGSYSESTGKPSIYPQGSINLGTIIRPLKDGKESDFDVDLVCQLQCSRTKISQEATKKEVGNRLKNNDAYRGKLDPEGKRCWTLTYAESAGIGFHIDVLPCVPDIANFKRYYKGYIAITHKDKDLGTYQWKPSNPNGYAEWFKERNTVFVKMATAQKKFLFESMRTSGKVIYSSVTDIPDQLVRTPLQRVIQLMKRHRDIRFTKNPDVKPISMIITTVAASLYTGQENVYSALIEIVEQMGLHQGLLENWQARLDEKIASQNLITRKVDGKWEIQNPACPGENFADRWHEDKDARAHAFFKWVQWLKEDISSILNTGTAEDLGKKLDQSFGERVASTVVKGLQPSTPKASLVTRIGSAAISLFSVSWRQRPDWPMQIVDEFDLDARLSKYDGFRAYSYQYRSGSERLDKQLSIRFTAPFFGNGCDYYWQVINTGDEAKWAGDLRGGFQVDGQVHTETTKYTGDHGVQCFVVRNGLCIARSREFAVKIG